VAQAEILGRSARDILAALVSNARTLPPKGEQEDLNEKQKTALRTVVGELKGS